MKYSKLISIRRLKGFSQKQLAKQIGMEQTTLSRKERGLSPISDAEWQRIATILQIPIKDIKEDIDHSILSIIDVLPQNQSGENKYITIPKDVFEQLLKSKDEQISLLKSIIEKN